MAAPLALLTPSHRVLILLAVTIVSLTYVLGADSSLPSTMQASRCAIEGRWLGRRAVRMPDGSSHIFSLFSFEFGGDGKYTFTLGNETKVWADQAGRYRVSVASDGGAQRYPCLVTLQPSPDTIRRDPSQRMNDDPIGFRDLTNGMEVTFRFRETGGSSPLSVMHTSVTGRDFLNDIGSFGLTPIGR